MLTPNWRLLEHQHQKAGAMEGREKCPRTFPCTEAYSAQGNSSSLCFWDLERAFGDLQGNLHNLPALFTSCPWLHMASKNPTSTHDMC